MVTITFESNELGEKFAHIESTSGVLGHAAEIKNRIPVGTFLTIPPNLVRVVPWLTKHCGFTYFGVEFIDSELNVVLKKSE